MFGSEYPEIGFASKTLLVKSLNFTFSMKPAVQFAWLQIMQVTYVRAGVHPLKYPDNAPDFTHLFPSHDRGRQLQIR